jgi:hypothetical protein
LPTMLDNSSAVDLFFSLSSPSPHVSVEFGFLPTTTDKRTAFAYSGAANLRGTVFEISAGQIDMGASISFLSQYPGEGEFLMPPLSCLEVVAQASHSIFPAISNKGQPPQTQSRFYPHSVNDHSLDNPQITTQAFAPSPVNPPVIPAPVCLSCPITSNHYS